jgi:hypothetical protein
MCNIQYEDLMMLRFYNTKSSMLYNLLKADEASYFILDKLLDKSTLQGPSAVVTECGFTLVPVWYGRNVTEITQKVVQVAVLHRSL